MFCGVKACENHQRFLFHNRFPIDHRMASRSQCAPGVFNLDQKFHGLFCFCDLDICKIDQNQLKKPSVDGVPTIFTFSIVKMALKCHQIENRKTLSKENLFFDCSCYGTVLADGFFS